jgi:hypothetical protein
MGRRALFAAGLAASVAVTAILWALGIPGFFLFLAVPFLFFPSHRRRAPGPKAGCASCGAGTEPGHRFCPRCGAAL